MLNNKKVLAIILARGGSKGIPNKNIKKLNDKPLIAYTIEEANKSAYIDKFILSTDDKEIASVSKTFGAEVPFLRPGNLATDTATSEDAMLHTINWLGNNQNFISDYVMLLQPTSPLRTVKDIDNSIEKIINEDGDSIIGLVKAEKHPYWMMEIKNGKVSSFAKTERKKYTRRQDLPDIYNINGAIYITKTELFKNTLCRWAGETLPYVMPKKRSIDIDDTMDWKLAELMLKEDKNVDV